VKESFSSHHHCTLLPPTFPPSFQFVVFNVVVQRFEGWFLAGGQGMCRFNRWVFSHRRRSVRLCCCSSWYRNVGFEPGKPDAAFSNGGCRFFSWSIRASLSDLVRGSEFHVSARSAPPCIVALSLWFVTPASRLSLFFYRQS
jgi:hypothetical protein